jgi:sortase B
LAAAVGWSGATAPGNGSPAVESSGAGHPSAGPPGGSETGEAATVAGADLAALASRNGDIRGWLTVFDTAIDYPVVQSVDNQYYLTRTAEGTPSGRGAIFLDFRQRPDFSDFNNVLYGHNLLSGEMFAPLIRFKDQAFFEAHPFGRLQTLGAWYRLEFFAVAVVAATGDHYRQAFPSRGDRSDHLARLRADAIHWRPLDLDPGRDRLLLLSTCSDEFEDARTVLVARLAETGEP